MNHKNSIKIIIPLLFLITLSQVQAIKNKPKTTKDTPIIGILSQPSGFTKFPEDQFSYIFTSYVQYFENHGARTIFIKYTEPYQKINDILDQINGLVIPGGGSNLFFRNEGEKQFSDFAEKGKYIIEQIIKKNEKGIYFPLWGTCLGFELMGIVFADNTPDILQQRDGKNRLGNISVFKDSFKKSKMFYKFKDLSVLKYVQENNVLFYNHKFGFQYEAFQNQYNLTDIFNVIAISHDVSGKNFISIAEHKQYPLYGVQFHPEKNSYDFDPNLPLNHGKQGIKFTEYLAEFFVKETQLNKQTVLNPKDIAPLFLSKYKPNTVRDYTMGVYFFNNKGADKKLIKKEIKKQSNKKLQQDEDEYVKQNYILHVFVGIIILLLLITYLIKPNEQNAKDKIYSPVSGNSSKMKKNQNGSIIKSRKDSDNGMKRDIENGTSMSKLK